MFQFLWLSTKYWAVLHLSVDPIDTLFLAWPVAKKKKRINLMYSTANYCDDISLILLSCICRRCKWGCLNNTNTSFFGFVT